jgi:signal transduction histidine kinase/two-component SAPR family response regulator
MAAPEPVNILLVDDQPGKLLSYEAILGSLGENLIRATSGREALEQLLRNEIAVVLVDVCMPELDGFELATMIRNHPRFQKTAIILASGVLVEDVDRLKGYDSGAVDYVSVPIVPEILRAKVAVFADLYRKSKELHSLNKELENRVAERTAEIEKAAAHLRESEERLRLVLAASHASGWTWDLRTDARERPGPGEEQPAGSVDGFLTHVHPDDRPEVRAALDRALATDGDYSAEFRLTESGEERWFLGRGTVLRAPSGKPIAISGINLDITERRRSEEERAALLARAQEARREAETANRLKDEFLATLSHELRTPLNAILGWAFLLRKGGLDPADEVKALDRITRSTELQSQLISDLIDMSRITTGKLRLDLAPLELASVVQAALDTVELAAEGKGIRLEAELDSGGRLIFGDAARLQQVVWNLLSNAVKFAPENGHIKVRLEKKGESAEITVQDDGPGIQPEFLPFVFDRFRQADSSSTRTHHGLGLGLAIVRHIVEMHGGTVHATNRKDQSGAILKIVVPANILSADAAKQLFTMAPGWPPENPGGPGRLLRNVRVLVVDDEPDSREVIAAVLEHRGAEAMVAPGVVEALDIVQREHPSVVIADIEMPGLDGYSLLGKIRALPSEDGAETPVVALTAYASPQDRAKALRAGFHAYLTKPAQPAELAEVVARLAGITGEGPRHAPPGG